MKKISSVYGKIPQKFQQRSKIQKISMLAMALVFGGIGTYATLNIFAAPQKCTSISKDGITWTFDKEYPCGQFANHDWWVAPNSGDSGVKITAMSPAYASGQNGWEVNPKYSGGQGFDQDVGGFSSSLVPSLPYSAQPNQSIVKTSSASGGCPNNVGCLQNAAVLTVLSGPPPDGTGAGYLRPPYVGTSKPLYSVSQLRTNLLPSLAPPSGYSPPSISSVDSGISKLQLDHKGGLENRNLHPRNNMPDYGSSIAAGINDAVGRLMFNDSPSAKLPLLVDVVQGGMDRYYMALMGQAWIGPGPGHNPGRKLSVTFAALMLNDSTMTNNVKTMPIFRQFHEDEGINVGKNGVPFFGGFSDAQTSESGYWSYLANASSNIEYADPYGYIDGGTYKGNINDYQTCCTSQPWKGAAIIMHLVPALQDYWQNHAKLQTYIDRWVTHGALYKPDVCAPLSQGGGPLPGNESPVDCVKDPDLVSPTSTQCQSGKTCGRFPSLDGTNKDAGYYRSDIVDRLWSAYRGSTPVTPPTDTTAPTISFTAPANNSKVVGKSVAVSANASDNTGVVGVQFKVNGFNLGGEDTSSPYSTTWDSTTVPDGDYGISATARDAAGNTKTATTTVTVENSTGQPTGNCSTVLSTSANLQTAINGLKPGNTLCLPPNSVYTANEYQIRGGISGTSASRITITSQDPSRPGTIKGRFVIFGGSNYITLSYLKLDASNYNAGASTFTNGGEHIQILHNDITNGNKTICLNNINSSSADYGTARYTVVDHNRIHNCGRLPSQNQDHGIYESGFNATITNNIIYDNVDRGIQMRGAQSATVKNNIVDGNGEGIIFGELNTSNNLVENNIFTNSKIRWNIETFWVNDVPLASGNVVKNNCVWTTRTDGYNQGGGVLPGLKGVTISGTIVADPQYVDRANKNFNLKSSSPCKDKAPDGVSTPPPVDPPDTTLPTISFATPSNGATVSGVVNSVVSASDNAGITKVEISLDGSLKMTDINAPYGYSFDSKTLNNGSHTLLAKAYDAAGNTKSATVTVTVNNPDTVAPSTPTNLSGSATNANTISLTWGASSDSGINASGIAKYNVLRKGPSDASFVVIAQPTTTSYTDTNRASNTSYSYVVQAQDKAGNVSANSNTVSIKTPTVVTPDTTAPSVPSGVVTTAVSTTQINISWKTSTDTGGSGLTGYNIYRNGTKINSSLLTSTSFGDSALSAGTSYSYRIEAIDGAGNKSNQSAPVSASTPAIVRGDVTGPISAPDGKIDIRDISYLIRNYNTADVAGDITGPNGTPDGKVDIYDLSYTIRNYGK